MKIQDYFKQAPPYELIKELMDQNSLSKLNVVWPFGAEKYGFIHGNVLKYNSDDDTVVLKVTALEPPSVIIPLQGPYELKVPRKEIKVWQ